MESIEKYFKGKENSKAMCYMLNDEDEKYKENKLNMCMSACLKCAKLCQFVPF